MSDLSSDLASLKIDRDQPASGSSGALRRWLLFVLAFAALMGLGYWLVWPRVEAAAFRTEVELTEVAVVSPAQAAVTLIATGYVVAERSSKVAPKVPGLVQAVLVRQGQQVEIGTPLLTMDPTDEQALIAAAQARALAARARAASARAQVATAEAQIREVKQQAERERRLADQGVSPLGLAEDLEARVASLRTAKAAAAAAATAASAEASASQAEVEVLQTNLKNLSLTASISGTVMNKPPEVGEFVGPQPAGVSVDMGGIELADFSTLVIEVDVPEQRLHLINLGGPAEIVLDAFPSERLRGRTKEITPRVDRAKATVIIRVEFIDPVERAMPDMSARVSFLTEALDAEAIKQPPKTIVPSSAIADRAGAKVVFAVESDQVRMLPVELGSAFGSGFELLRGPSPGTRLVRNPSETLADGQRIKEKVPE